jgi:diaminopimelate epimerase
MSSVQTTLKFTKMQGLGNDFMVVNALNNQFDLSAQQIQLLADRHFGIGFDQLLVVEAPSQDQVDFRYRIFNADGSEVQQCGNGARCFARYVFDKGLTSKTEIVVETASGIIVLFVEDNDQVRVNMGKPSFTPESLPFEAETIQNAYSIDVLEHTLEIGAVSMGNPHAVIKVDNADLAAVDLWGAALESHARFPERVNVGFAEVQSRQKIKLRVYERGAAETLACGTGACAAMVVMRQWKLVDDVVTVALPGGDLIISWDGKPNSEVWMTGPAVTVYEGEVNL